MLQSAIDLLNTHGLVRETPRTLLADRIIGYLAEDHVVENGTPDEIQSRAAIVAEIRENILGSSGDDEADEQLQAMFTNLLSVEGLVQHRLSDGMVLCSAKVIRVDEEGKEAQRTGRFLSGNPDVALAYCYAPAVDRSVAAGEKSTRLLDLCTARIPALELRRNSLLDNARARYELAIGTRQAAS